ncbi:hypothetical protein [Opitutus sp. ER46]|uniref:hypothetical protein n=1 Tax=Opitutus sp. ER46 TaxID=2161864 RepID=UPI000D3007BC|nr:hypothetical protein [Opitutus sp. ER46]PTX97965.1 hypothetical protein DB354_06765 [Opitutus sp. ER46]
MKFSLVTLSLLLALPVAVSAQSKATKTWMNGRAVTIVTDVTTQAPAVCQTAMEQALDQQGWHDQIYRATEGDKAFLIVSQREEDACSVKEVKVTLWRAVSVQGKTHTESWVYRLAPSEVNRFLDSELRSVALQFTSAPVKLPEKANS